MIDPKKAALEDLIQQMYDLMIAGKGDETMGADEVSEAVEAAGDGPSGDDSPMGDIMEGDEESEDCEVDERSDFMKGRFDRPKRKSLILRPKAPEKKMDLVKEMMSSKDKFKGKGRK